MRKGSEIRKSNEHVKLFLGLQTNKFGEDRIANEDSQVFNIDIASIADDAFKLYQRTRK